MSNICGAGSSLSGTSSLIFNGGNLTAGDSCTFQVTASVSGATSEGGQTLATSNLSAVISAATRVLEPGYLNLNIAVPASLDLSMSFDPSTSVTPNSSVQVEFELSNLSTSDDVSEINFTVDLSSFLSGAVYTAVPVSGFCGGSSAASGTSGATLTISDASLVVNGSCTFSATISIPASAAFSTHYDAVSSALSATINSVAVMGATARTRLMIIDDPVTTPTISIGAASASRSNGGDVTYVVSYTGATNIILAPANISLNTTGTAGASVAVNNITTTSVDVVLTPVGDGSVGISIAAGTARGAGVALAPAAGPSVTFSVDTVAPIISLTGANPQTIELGAGYTELGATTDDGSTIVIDASVFVDAVGSYPITYNASDAENNAATQVTRTVNVVDTTAPIITLTGATPQTIELGAAYTELGATTDDGSTVVIDASAFVDAVGSYTITYNATDAENNEAIQLTRTVEVLDTRSVLSIAATTHALEDSADGVFTVSTDALFTVPTLVSFTVAGSATPASDYASLGSQFTFPANQSVVTLRVDVTADNVLEANETVQVTLSGTDNPRVIIGTANNKATLNIEDNDTASVTIANVSGNEDDGSVTVTAILDNAVQGGFSVALSTADGSATIADNDYTAVTLRPLTFAGLAGETQTLVVTPTSDTRLEGNETVLITQSSLALTSLPVDISGTGTVTITEDDSATLTIEDVSVNEGDGDITLTATLDKFVPGGFTVEVSTQDDTATIANADYTELLAELLTFTGTAGETQTFTVTGIDDATLEADEVINILQANLGATALSVDITDQATVTLTNDDSAAVTIADISRNEDGGGITLSAVLDNAVDGGFTVDVSTVDGSATVADGDYQALAAQTLTFIGTAGERQNVTITPSRDSKVEADEVFSLIQDNLQGNLAATALAVDITDQASVTLINDDAATLSITSANDATEGCVNRSAGISGAEISEH